MFSGIFEEKYMTALLADKFLEGIYNNSKELNDWKTKYGKSVNESFREYVLEYIGKSFVNLFK